MDGMPLPCLLCCQTAYGQFNCQLLVPYIMLSIVSIASLVVCQHKFIDLVQDRASNFDNSKFGGLRRVRGRGEYPQVLFNLTFCAN